MLQRAVDMPRHMGKSKSCGIEFSDADANLLPPVLNYRSILKRAFLLVSPSLQDAAVPFSAFWRSPPQVLLPYYIARSPHPSE